MQRQFKGHFITLEGERDLAKRRCCINSGLFLNTKRLRSCPHAEPGGTHSGETIRDWLLHQKLPQPSGVKQSFFFFLAARAQHIKEEVPSSASTGKIVLCDRFNDSTVAYQGGARDLGIQHVQNLCNLVCGCLLCRS